MVGNRRLAGDTIATATATTARPVPTKAVTTTTTRPVNTTPAATTANTAARRLPRAADTHMIGTTVRYRPTNIATVHPRRQTNIDSRHRRPTPPPPPPPSLTPLR